MRKKFLAKAQVEDVRVDMSSLVDISFLLLIFFLVTSTLLARERDLSMNVPVSSGEPVAQGPIQLRIEADDRVVLHPGQSYQEEVVSVDTGRDLRGLKERLIVLKGAQRGLQIEAADEASYQRFVDVMDSLTEVGWSAVSIVQE